MRKKRTASSPRKIDYRSYNLWNRDVGCATCGGGDYEGKISVVQMPGAYVEVLGLYRREAGGPVRPVIEDIPDDEFGEDQDDDFDNW
ncbi:MAG TPA: hypothetical protein GXX29_03545 [Firmicutes bacterium]|nr:hypothetical protein [Bacillota bacterium]